MCKLPTGFMCFHQLQPGSWLAVLRTALIISSSTARHRDALSALEITASSDVDGSLDGESPVLFTEVLHLFFG